MKDTATFEAMQEMTLMLMYLTRFREQGRFADPSGSFHVWKDYDFDTLDALDEADLIFQSRPMSRSKSVTLTEAGIAQAKALLKKYHIVETEGDARHE